MISQKTIEEIRERGSLFEIASESIAFRRVGGNYVGLCPFHAEKTPSFHVRDDKYYHCFGCGASGNIFSYVMQSKGLSFPEAVEDLAARLGLVVAYEGPSPQAPVKGNRAELYRINALANEFFRKCILQAEPPVRTYLKSRGISREAFEMYAIGFAPKSWGGLKGYLAEKGVAEETVVLSGLARRSPKGELYDTFRGRLMFPVFSDNRHIAGFGGRIVPGLFDQESLQGAPKYLNSSESAVYEKSKIFYGLPQAMAEIRGSGAAYLVEGYLDVIGLWQVGVRNVIATCGTAVTEKHVRRLKHLCRRIYVLFDGDKAGRAAAAKSFILFMNSGLDVAAKFLPQGEDPDTFAQKKMGDTVSALEGLGSSPLLDCYIDDLLLAAGCSTIREAGAALKGRLCEEVAGALRRVENAVERNELLQRAAHKLIVSSSSLEDLAAQAAGGRELKKESGNATERPAQGEGCSSIPPMASLPALDRQLLQAVMVRKEDLCPMVLRDAEMCSLLHIATLQFIDALDQIVSAERSPPEQKKDQIRLLLGQYGPSWLEHWRRSYDMSKDKEVDLEQVFEGCRLGARKIKLNRAIDEVEKALATCSDETEKLALAAQKLELLKQLARVSKQVGQGAAAAA